MTTKKKLSLLLGGLLALAVSGHATTAEMPNGGSDKKITVSAQLADKEGKALEGGKVTAKHVGEQVMTNEKGKFTLKTAESDTLVIFYPGKQKMEIAAQDITTKQIVLEDFVVQDKEGVFYVADPMPVFREGEMSAWVARNIRYPMEAQARGATGKINVTFIVDEQGNVTNVNTLPPRNKAFADDVALLWEAIRVVSSMPRWTPGEVDGKPVRVRCYVPVSFRNMGVLPKEQIQKLRGK